MLTRQQVIDIFVAGINEIPVDELIQVYETFTQEQLDKVIARNLAARRDPTYTQRVAEDYQKYIAATPEEQVTWTHVEPNPAP
jgi:hypothetical protein